jgi:predicted lipid-binding transport protein (Tim44 family)
MIPVDIIILGFITGFILYRLYITIGKKDDDGNIHRANNNDINNIIDISAMVKVEEEPAAPSANEIALSVGFEEVVENIRKIDANFSLEKFLEGAKKAFEMVLAAFSENDRETLESLLDDKIYKQFISEIDKRIANNVSLSLTLVALPEVKIKDIKLNKKTVSISVFYHSQQITILKNSAGDIIEGNTTDIDNVEDFWTFSKDLGLKNNWLLVEVNVA